MAAAGYPAADRWSIGANMPATQPMTGASFGGLKEDLIRGAIVHVAEQITSSLCRVTAEELGMVRLLGQFRSVEIRA
jgi:hypothetical protein